jgi:hypothetical protein
MTNPNGHGGRRPGAGRPKSQTTLLREAAEELLSDLPQLLHRRQSRDPLVDELRRLTEIEARLRLTEDKRHGRAAVTQSERDGMATKYGRRLIAKAAEGRWLSVSQWLLVPGWQRI